MTGKTAQFYNSVFAETISGIGARNRDSADSLASLSQFFARPARTRLSCAAQLRVAHVVNAGGDGGDGRRVIVLRAAAAEGLNGRDAG